MKKIVLIAIIFTSLFTSCASRYITYVQPYKIDNIDTLKNGLIKVNLSPIQKATPLAPGKFNEGEIVQVMSSRKS
ncbi:MAG: hypothetical protein JWQ40_949 [Segetibacter sp.]|jgi:hypothetical protein|nr:hypothetical protein [Segetibacter sp.]